MTRSSGAKAHILKCFYVGAEESVWQLWSPKLFCGAGLVARAIGEEAQSALALAESKSMLQMRCDSP